jgi:hypothetical protein
MSDNNWPDPARPGVPLNPEQSRWHWLKTPDGLEVPYEWRAAGECERGRWPAYWVSVDADDWQPAECTYLGPCLTPGEVGARVKEAVDLGRDNATRDLDPQIAMLIPWQTAIEDALSNWCDAVADDETPKDALRHLIQIEMDAALDPKVSQAAADLVAKAKRDALEEAARWHDEQTVWMIKGRRLAKAEEHRKHAAAIRALGEKE